MGSDALNVSDVIEASRFAADVAPGFTKELRSFLDSRARDATSDLDPSLLPLRLPKSRLASLDRCERLAVAESVRSASPDPMTLARFRGVALDHYVAHQLAAGRVLEPVEALRSMLAAEADEEMLDYLSVVEGDPDSMLTESLAALAGAVAVGWSGIAPQWFPRTQTMATLVLGNASVVCSGRIDVELGGVLTGLPGILVEVKSGQPRAEHAAEMYYYSLIVALRDGKPPASLLRWYPGAAPALAPISEALLESAAVRLADAMEKWAELVAMTSGESLPDDARPKEVAGPWCGWCPDSAICPSFTAVPR